MRGATRAAVLVGVVGAGALVWWATRPEPARPATAPGAPDPFPFRPIPRPATASSPSRSADAAGDAIRATDARSMATASPAGPDASGRESAEQESAEQESAEPVAGGDTPTTGATWVAPDDEGACPLSHPVKANASSRIFHVPGGMSYERTKAERCYVSPEAAGADGFRAAKR